MDRKYWVLIIILVLALVFVVCLWAIPGLDEALANNVGLPIVNGVKGTANAIVTSHIWVTYIAPIDWIISGVFFFIVGAWLVYAIMIQERISFLRRHSVADQYQDRPKGSRVVREPASTPTQTPTTNSDQTSNTSDNSS